MHLFYLFPSGFHDSVPPCIRFLVEYLPWDSQQAPETSLHPQTTFSSFFSWWMAPVCSPLPDTITGINLFSSGSLSLSVCLWVLWHLNSSRCQPPSLSPECHCLGLLLELPVSTSRLSGLLIPSVSHVMAIQSSMLILHSPMLILVYCLISAGEALPPWPVLTFALIPHYLSLRLPI